MMRKMEFLSSNRVLCGMLLAVGLVSGAFPPIVSSQVIRWSRQFGTANAEEAIGISVHSSGVYVGGYTTGTLPGQTSVGNFDAFVRKYDSQGNHLWTRQFGSTGYARVIDISVDASGVYVSGDVSGVMPGQSGSGGADAFVRKYDFSGNEIWTRQFGSSQTDEAFSISAHASGIYVAGFTSGTLPGQSSTTNLSAFVRKYDLDGNEAWTRQFSTGSGAAAFGISADDSGAYVAAEAFVPVPPPFVGNTVHALIRKYDTEGAEVWTRQFAESTTGRDVSVGAAGVYLFGDTYETLPGQLAAGLPDVFVRRYDVNGNEVWTRQFGSPNYDDALGGFLDGSAVYIAGRTEGALPGQTSAGSEDAFVRKYDLSGSEVWTRQFGTALGDRVYNVSGDGSGAYVAGYTAGALAGQTALGGGDAFAVKLTAEIPSPGDLVQVLISQVVALNLRQGLSNSLDAKLQAALKAIDDLNEHNTAAAINTLQAFIHNVEIQKGAEIPVQEASDIIALALETIRLLGG